MTPLRCGFAFVGLAAFFRAAAFDVFFAAALRFFFAIAGFFFVLLADFLRAFLAIGRPLRLYRFVQREPKRRFDRAPGIKPAAILAEGRLRRPAQNPLCNNNGGWNQIRKAALAVGLLRRGEDAAASADYRDLAGGRRLADLAVQLGLGLLPLGRARPGRDHSADPGIDGTALAMAGRTQDTDHGGPVHALAQKV